MNDAVLVSIIKSQTDLDDDRNRISPVQMSVLVDEILNRNAFDIFLNDVSEVTFMSYTENLNDVSVVKRRNGLGLCIESSDEFLV